MKSVHLCVLLASLAGGLGIAAQSVNAEPGPVKFAAPYRVMYGYCDPEDLRVGGFWQSREEWNNSWEDVFQHFNVITGRTTDADLVKRLRAKGKVFAYHVQNKNENWESLLQEWSRPFEDTLNGDLPGGFDAISIDELHSNPDGSVESDNTIKALRELHKRWPHKIIIAWAVAKVGLGGSTGSYGKRYAEGHLFDRQLKAVADCCNLLIIESYQREANPHFAMANEVAHNLEARHPGLIKKTIIGLGISQSPDLNYDDRPDMDFGEHLEKQIKLIHADHVLKQTPGIGFWAFYRAKPELMPTLNGLVDKYYPPAP
ncbi:MAG: hypothetical protein U0903_18285 [Planctomycetales bacterium]